MTDIILPDMDAWADFAAANKEQLVADCGSIEAALTKACQGGLVMGGGAAPQFFIGFAE